MLRRSPLTAVTSPPSLFLLTPRKATMALALHLTWDGEQGEDRAQGSEGWG